MTVRKIAAGARDNYLGFLNDSGQFIGGTPSDPAAGTASGMLELLGIQEVPLTVPDPTSVPILGDDVVLGEFEFDSDAPRAYIITMAVHDLQTDAYLLGTNVESIAGGDWGSMDIIDPVERNVCLIHQSRAKKYDANNKGQKAWEGVYVPLATAKPLYRQTFSSRTGATYRIYVAPQVASYDVGGVTFSEGGAGTTGLRMRPFRSNYPYHAVAFVGNGVLTAIPLDHRPVNVASSAAWRDQGIPLTINSVSTSSPYTATLSAAPASDRFGTVLYQYDQK